MKKFAALISYLLCGFWVLGQRTVTHPFLLVSKTDIQKIKQDIAFCEWKRACWERLKESADLFLSQDIEIPHRGGNWQHYYVNPANGNELVTRKLTGDWQWEHIDTATGQKFTGDSTAAATDLDGVVVSIVHENWAIGALQLGLAYQISGNKAYAHKAKQILLSYAQLYPTLTVRNRLYTQDSIVTGWGKLFAQDLNEAIWLIDIVQSADLIWDQLSNKEADNIIRNILYPCADLIARNRIGIHNMQSWKNAALGMVGLFTRNSRYTYLAIEDTAMGMKAQIKNGFSSEGLSYDISPTYHYYHLGAIVALTQAARNAGYDAVDVASIKSLFDVPLFMTNSFLHLPAFNDSKFFNIAATAYLYEWAYREWRNEVYTNVIGKSDRTRFNNLGPQFTGWSLLFGDTRVMQKHFFSSSSVNLPDAGVAVLSKGLGSRNVQLHLKYSNQLVNRGHFQNAQLDFAIIKGNRSVGVVPGITQYGSPLAQEWYRTSVAHNTFVVNAKNQNKSNGKCIAFGKHQQVDYVITETDNAYDSVKVTRTAALLSEDLILIVDQFRSSRQSKLFTDFVYHQAGDWNNLPKGAEWQPSKQRGYKYLTGNAIHRKRVRMSLSTTIQPGIKVMANLAAADTITVLTAYGKASVNEKVPVMMMRTSAKNMTLVYCISTRNDKVGIVFEKVKGMDNNLLPLEDAAKIRLQLPGQPPLSVLINPHKLVQVNGGNEQQLFEVQPAP